MNREQAYRILGLSNDADSQTIKKKYRQLMHKAHPDAEAFQNEDVKSHSAAELNEAYAYLTKRSVEIDLGKKSKERSGSSKAGAKSGPKQEPIRWNAPCNENAYCVRKVFHPVEDGDGEKIGSFCVAEGKYFWTPDEDFSLFMKSIFLCGKELLDRVDEECQSSMSGEERMPIQAELTYLLAVQFIDSIASLKKLAGVKYDKEKDTFSMAAMLEMPGENRKLKTGDYLLPQKVKNHRLFLTDVTGNEAGYLSFLDDRLYYVVIPLFEQKSVQIKIQIVEKKENATGKKRSRMPERYKNLELCIRFLKENKTSAVESLGLQIEALLERYRGML